MRKISSLVLSSILGMSVLSGCGSQTADFSAMQTIAPQQTVSAQSTKGLNAYMDATLKRTFNIIDMNKDGFITFIEFSVPPNNTPPNPSQPSTQARANSVKTAVQPLPDDKARFAKLDINRDGKLSLAETKKNPRYFLGIDKSQIRKSVKLAFDTANTDKNNTLSQQEYSTFFTNAPYEAKFFLSSLFYTSDVNKNGSLTFSEYEDLFYGQMQAYMAVPNPNDPVPVPVAPVEDPGYNPSPVEQPVPIAEPVDPVDDTNY